MPRRGCPPLSIPPQFGADAPDPSLMPSVRATTWCLQPGTGGTSTTQHPKASTPACSAAPPVTTQLLCSIPHWEHEEELKFNLFHAAFSCQMSQSTGLTQPLFCLAASAGFCLVFVQYLTPLMALGLKPASATEKSHFSAGAGAFPAFSSTWEQCTNFIYFSQLDEALSLVLRATTSRETRLKLSGLTGAA